MLQKETTIYMMIAYGTLSITTVVMSMKSIYDRRDKNHQNEVGSKTETSTFIVLVSKAVISINELVTITVEGDYCEFQIVDHASKEIDRTSLKKITEKLPVDRFIQISRNVLVNRTYIDQLTATSVALSTGEVLPVTRQITQAYDQE